MSELLIPSFLVSDVSESLRSLTKNEWCEQIPQFAHQKMSNHERFPHIAQWKWAIVSQSLRSLWLSELLVFFEGMSESIIFFKRIAHSLIFGQKTSDLLGKPMSEFPALLFEYSIYIIWVYVDI